MLSNLGDKETGAPGFQRPDAASVLQRAFRLLFAQSHKKLCGEQVLQKSSSVRVTSVISSTVLETWRKLQMDVLPRLSLSVNGRNKFLFGEDDTKAPDLRSVLGFGLR